MSSTQLPETRRLRRDSLILPFRICIRIYIYIHCIHEEERERERELIYIYSYMRIRTSSRGGHCCHGKCPRCGRGVELLQAVRHSYRMYAPSRDRKSLHYVSSLFWPLSASQSPSVRRLYAGRAIHPSCRCCWM